MSERLHSVKLFLCKSGTTSSDEEAERASKRFAEQIVTMQATRRTLDDDSNDCFKEENILEDEWTLAEDGEDDEDEGEKEAKRYEDLRWLMKGLPPLPWGFSKFLSRSGVDWSPLSPSPSRLSFSLSLSSVSPLSSPLPVYDLVVPTAHSFVACGIAVHNCDLKPENILFVDLASPHIKLIDFGSACFENQTVYSYIQSRFYRCPEVLLGYRYSSSIDLWSLGCIAAELFLGLPLFPGTSEYNQLDRIIQMQGMPPRYLIEEGKSAAKFFMKVGNDYILKPEDMYARFNPSHRKHPPKRYFMHNNIPDLIMNYHWPKGMTPDQIEQERHARVAFIDFLGGLLNMDPRFRWTAEQAIKHPFLTGEPFGGHFVPEESTKHKVAGQDIPGQRGWQTQLVSSAPSMGLLSGHLNSGGGFFIGGGNVMLSKGGESLMTNKGGLGVKSSFIPPLPPSPYVNPGMTTRGFAIGKGSGGVNTPGGGGGGGGGVNTPAGGTPIFNAPPSSSTITKPPNNNNTSNTSSTSSSSLQSSSSSSSSLRSSSSSSSSSFSSSSSSSNFKKKHKQSSSISSCSSFHPSSLSAHPHNNKIQDPPFLDHYQQSGSSSGSSSSSSSSKHRRSRSKSSPRNKGGNNKNTSNNQQQQQQKAHLGPHGGGNKLRKSSSPKKNQQQHSNKTTPSKSGGRHGRTRSKTSPPPPADKNADKKRYNNPLIKHSKGSSSSSSPSVNRNRERQHVSNRAPPASVSEQLSEVSLSQQQHHGYGRFPSQSPSSSSSSSPSNAQPKVPSPVFNADDDWQEADVLFP